MFTTQRHDGRARRHARFHLEPLDDRLVLSAGFGGAAAESVAQSPLAKHADLRNLAHDPHGPLGRGSHVKLPANVSPALRLLYREFEHLGGSRNATSLPGGTPVVIGGARVAVKIKADFPPSLDTELFRLRAVGLRVVRIIPNEGLAVGTLPIAALPAVGEIPVVLEPATPSVRR
jgi:hypothetical protein